MRVGGLFLGSSCEWRKAILCGSAVISIYSIPSRGQNVAEAARQENTRKAAEQKSHKHVYTEDDLKRQVILTPDDQARVEARKQKSGAPAEQNAEQTPNDSAPLTESTGEIARRYRKGTDARDAKSAERKKFTAFPFEGPQRTLASPVVGVEPLVRDGSSMIPFRPSIPHVPTSAGASRNRLSPFLPRPNTGKLTSPPATLVVAPVVPTKPFNSKRSVEQSVAPVPATSGMLRIAVERGQSWWRLADLYLGDGTRWRELRELNANAGGPPELLKVGSTVVVPERVNAVARIAPGVITVRQGDSLWSLARRYLGKGSAWSCLATTNPQIADDTRLTIGSTIHLPAGDNSGSCRSITVPKSQK